MQAQAGRHEQPLRIERRYAGAQHTESAQVQVGRFLDGVAEVGAQRADSLQEALSWRRQSHAAAAAREQREAQFGFQPLDALGDGRLRHIRVGRRAPHLAMAGDGQEVVQVFQAQ